mmetsp:Transcript_30130/g.65218  ORF Transcript_30130/g.65218 Transcript_30130/m.65218 type:complete len:238 (+) Transcript_30130:83-796(+)
MASLTCVVALLLCWLSLLLVDVDGRSASSPIARSVATRHHRSLHAVRPAFTVPRGGATLVDDEYDEEEYDEYDEEESEDEEEAAAALAAATKEKAAAKAKKAKAKAAALSASAVKASAKAKSKRTATAKESVSVKLATTPKRKSGKSILELLRVPYIVRACLNPVTVIAMTRAYFASLFNIAYLEEESSQTLRSALEDKAKKTGGSTGGGGGGGKRGKRAMRPGQAKTLSDLPQLSA